MGASVVDDFDNTNCVGVEQGRGSGRIRWISIGRPQRHTKVHFVGERRVQGSDRPRIGSGGTGPVVFGARACNSFGEQIGLYSGINLGEATCEDCVIRERGQWR